MRLTTYLLALALALLCLTSFVLAQDESAVPEVNAEGEQPTGGQTAQQQQTAPSSRRQGAKGCIDRCHPIRRGSPLLAAVLFPCCSTPAVLRCSPRWRGTCGCACQSVGQAEAHGGQKHTMTAQRQGRASRNPPGRPLRLSACCRPPLPISHVCCLMLSHPPLCVLCACV